MSVLEDNFWGPEGGSRAPAARKVGRFCLVDEPLWEVPRIIPDTRLPADHVEAFLVCGLGHADVAGLAYEFIRILKVERDERLDLWPLQ